MNNRTYYLAFSAFEGIGPARMQKLLARFGTAKKAWEGNAADVGKTLGKILSGRFLEFRKTFSLQAYVGELDRKNIQWVTIEDKEYPQLLKNTVNIPFLLYCKGDISLLNHPRAIAIVGTRKITTYGRQVTELLTRDLVNAGFIIISGLAYGVDACAHGVTIDTGGKTIAVLGCGVDCCSPRDNQYLYDKILSTGGLIVSQFLPASSPTKGSFPARNRIIAGLSMSTIVTEGAQDSGALITADYAFQYSRPVFAVPGPITSGLSKGPNALLQKGAIAVVNGEDIIKVLRRKYKVETHPFVSPPREGIKGRVQNDSMSKEEKQILTFLEAQPLHFDEIVRKIGKPAKDVGSILSLMEIKGLVRIEGGIYSINLL